MKKILATLLILCAGPVLADWSFLSKLRNENGEVVAAFFDKTTIKGQKVKQVWTKLEFSAPTSNGVRSLRALTEIDCREEKARMVRLASFSGPKLSGEVMQDINFYEESGWQPIKPSSYKVGLFNAVCEETYMAKSLGDQSVQMIYPGKDGIMYRCPTERPGYPRRSQIMGEQGETVLEFTVNPSGEVANIEVISSSEYPRLDSAAIGHLSKCVILFTEPAITGKKFRQRFVFALK